MNTTEQLSVALDWCGIDYHVAQSEDKELTQITISTEAVATLIELLITGSKHI